MKYEVFHSIRIMGSATIASLRIQHGITDFIQWTPLGLGGHIWAYVTIPPLPGRRRSGSQVERWWLVLSLATRSYQIPQICLV